MMYESAWYYSGLLWWLDDSLAVRVLMVAASKMYRSYCFFCLSVCQFFFYKYCISEGNSNTFAVKIYFIHAICSILQTRI